MKSNHPAITPEQTAPQIDTVVEKYDVESRFRKYLPGTIWGRLAAAIAISMSVFHLWLASIGILPAIMARAIHLSFVLVLIFLLYPARPSSRKDRPSTADFFLIVGSVIIAGYMLWRYTDYAMSGGFPNNADYLIGALACILVLEGGRRSIGPVLPCLALVFVAYAYLGKYIPGNLGHFGYKIPRLMEMFYLSLDGIYGVAIGVSTTYIFLFILFGAFLGETGMSRFINDISMAMAGRSPGGPAKVAVFASGFMGTINGSAVANVATTGAFTIPLMKSIGYRPHFAGAVEAVASTGGQIMPPVMGAAAFIMAEILNVQYKVVMFAALIPAILYYLACYVGVHLEAVKTGLRGLTEEELPNIRQVLLERGHMVLPLVLIVALLVKGFTPTYSAFYGIVATILASFLRSSTRLSWRGFLAALENGARGAVTVAIACAVVGFIVGVSAMTGFGLKLGDAIISMAAGNLFLTLVLAAITCLILGMGMPTTAVYIVAATMAAPMLVKIGINPIAAHLFAFYFGNISNITPPVALAAFTGAGIAGADPNRVGFTAVRLGIAAFIVPFMFVYSPQLVMQQGTALQIIGASATAIVGVIGLGAAFARYLLKPLSWLETLILGAGALALIKPGLYTDIVGLGGFALIYLRQRAGLSLSAKKDRITKSGKLPSY
ncbi:MAG: TRAP transporter permease [Bacillota bacterium]